MLKIAGWEQPDLSVQDSKQNNPEKGSVSASLSVTWLFVGVGEAIIPHLKEDIQGYLLI